MCLLQLLIWLVLVSLSSCTDLAAVYKHDILLLRDVDKMTQNLPRQWESLVLPLPNGLSFPIGLTYDLQGNRLFIADAVHDDTKIFALSLDSDYKVTATHAVVKDENIIVIEDMSYDPTSKHLYWIDTYAHTIFKTSIPDNFEGNDALDLEHLKVFTNTVKPRGIAVDYCNELLYWSKRNGSGEVKSSVEMLDLAGDEHRIIQHDKDLNFYYQGLTYDFPHGALVWAETLGDNYTTSCCRIVTSPSRAAEHCELLSMENCFPFSLTVDEEYIYWADWGKQGIMRASLTNPDDVVKLVHTPSVISDISKHHGVYGLALLNSSVKNSSLDLCKGQKKFRCKDHKSFKCKVDNMTDLETDIKSLPAKPSHPESATEEIYKDAIISAKSATIHSLNSSASHTENVGHEGKKNIKPVKHNTEKINKYNNTSADSISTNSMNSVESRAENVDGQDAKKNVISSVKHENEAFHNASLFLQTNASMIKEEMCNEAQLLWVIIVLGVLCTIFMFSTALLLVKLFYQRKPSIHKQVPAHTPRKVKRFGPKKQYGSGNKSSPCSELSSNDGVSINIEDCCQMTMCETLSLGNSR
ncbi:low-density lipoprotein receptor 2 isoform X2 [Cherax quadricarinatus]|uniref:low-density lipoprotein receptor 2 isoform X2 n=1 Tax=Cherax quadricarinatus TaxID=27406 RepID=UPI00387EC081